MSAYDRQPDETEHRAAAAVAAMANVHGPLTLLRRGNNALYRCGDTVVRVSRPHATTSTAGQAEIVACLRLDAAGVPVVRPSRRQAYTATGDRVVTFWEYLPDLQTNVLDAGQIGRLARDFHDRSRNIVIDALRADWSPLPATRQRLELLAASGAFTDTELAPLQAWERKLTAWLATGPVSVLGHGLLHGDLHGANVLHDRSGRVWLGDWETVAYGPREWDLVAMLSGSALFGAPEATSDAFSLAYGYDLRTSPDWENWLRLRALMVTTWRMTVALEDEEPGGGRDRLDWWKNPASAVPWVDR